MNPEFWGRIVGEFLFALAFPGVLGFAAGVFIRKAYQAVLLGFIFVASTFYLGLGLPGLIASLVMILVGWKLYNKHASDRVIVAPLLITVFVGFLFVQGQKQSPYELLESGEYEGPGAKTFELIRQYHPEEFREASARFSNLWREGASRREMQVAISGFIAHLHNKYLHHIAKADDQQLKVVFQRSADLLEALSADTSLCNAFVLRGINAMPVDAVEEHRELIEAVDYAVLSAIFGAEKSDIAPRVASEYDYEQVVDGWLTSGATEADVASVGDPQADDANLCPSMRSFMEYLGSANQPAAERVRASWFTIPSSAQAPL